MKTLEQWLSWQESLHLSAIDLGLDRIQQVAERMNLLSLPFPVITVAGTNGKGSTCAILTSILKAADYHVGTYTSPHILRYNERICLSQIPANDELICQAFTAIDQARGDISLTYFEFGTLAAIWVFVQKKVDIAVLEIGLGGRLDAANLWDADVALVTSIDLDHSDWLGTDREVIGAEKAAIARKNKPLICGELEPPASIKTTADEIGASLLQLNQDFYLEVDESQQQFSICDSSGLLFDQLPMPNLAAPIQLNNAACAVMALAQLSKVVVSQAALQQGLKQVVLQGRLQQVKQSPAVWVDVAHNPQAARVLAQWLEANPIQGKTYALFSMLADKDIESVLDILKPHINEWHVFSLTGSRALSSADMEKRLQQVTQEQAIVLNEDLANAWSVLNNRLTPVDRVVAFGSFLVVSEVLSFLASHSES